MYISRVINDVSANISAQYLWFLFNMTNFSPTDLDFILCFFLGHLRGTFDIFVRPHTTKSSGGHNDAALWDIYKIYNVSENIPPVFLNVVSK